MYNWHKKNNFLSELAAWIEVGSAMLMKKLDITHKSKWLIILGFVIAITIIVLATLFSKETILINEQRIVQPPPTLSPSTQSSISGTVKFDSTSVNSFKLDYSSKVHIDLTAEHYGVGAVITDSTGSHLLDLSFNNILGVNNPSGEFTGNPSTYNVTISGPPSFAVSDVGKPISYGLTLTIYRIITSGSTTETISIIKSVRNWTKFYLILIPGLLILIYDLVLVILYFINKSKPPGPSGTEGTKQLPPGDKAGTEGTKQLPPGKPPDWVGDRDGNIRHA